MLKDEFILWKYCFWKLQKLLKLIHENWSMLFQASYMEITLLKHFPVFLSVSFIWFYLYWLYLTQKLLALDLLFFSPNSIINTKIMWLQQNVENYVSARITFIKLEQTEVSDINSVQTNFTVGHDFMIIRVYGLEKYGVIYAYQCYLCQVTTVISLTHETPKLPSYRN